MGRKKQHSNLPTFDDLLIPTLDAIIGLGGSGSIEEINTKVYEIAHIPDDVLQIPHGDGGAINKVDYRLAWSRTYLKKFGLLENSSRSIWALSKSGIDSKTLDKNEITRTVREQAKNSQPKTIGESEQKTQQQIEYEVEVTEGWKENLLNTLYNISPSAFELLAQRILRESGFFQVEVTGKTGDGRIDGKGIVRISGFLIFHVIFQCKRYKSSVTSDKIRDFRGAMQGRADKGLFITTGTFTKMQSKKRPEMEHHQSI